MDIAHKIDEYLSGINNAGFQQIANLCYKITIYIVTPFSVSPCLPVSKKQKERVAKM
jgi:hypothetical protein